MNKKKISLLIFTSILVLLLIILSLFLLNENTSDSVSNNSKKEKMSTSRIASDTEYKNNDVEDEYTKLLAKKEDVPSNTKGENDSTAENSLKSPTTSEKKPEEKSNLEDSKSLTDSVGTYKIKKIDGIKFRIYSDGKRIPDANMTDTKSTTKPNEKLAKKNTPDIMDKENMPDYLLKNDDSDVPKDYTKPNKYSKLLSKVIGGNHGEVRAENDGNSKFAYVVNKKGETPIYISDVQEKKSSNIPPYKRISFKREWYISNTKEAETLLKNLDLPKNTDYLLNEAKKVLKGNYISNSKVHRITFDAVGGLQFEFYD